MPPVVFSRHAQRRMKLYKISPQDVNQIVGEFHSAASEKSGRYEILSDLHHEIYRHPLKVVFIEADDKIIIITVYPLKKGRLP
jgi:hypothetical protein